MKHIVAAFLLALLAIPAGASELRIALDQDPEVLDPAQAGTYVGRIVFAAMCDKLVDVDERMKFVPQLATAEARTTTDADARAKLYAKASGIYLDDRPALFLYHYRWL
ncbi:MAG TPA: hypothetical protein VGG57_21110 [Stellaceae bacterium]|jgi:ABC-type transport system substrate-binding protein